MSDSVFSIQYIDNGQTVSFEEESAGKIGKYLGVIAAVIVPFAAPAIWGAIAGSTFLSTALGSAATSALTGTLGSTIGSAAVGAIMNAGAAYAGGARGGAVWQAAGMGAMQGGIGGFMHGAGAAAAGVGNATTGATTGAGALPGAVVGIAPSTAGGISDATLGYVASAGAPAQATGALATGTASLSQNVANGIRSMFGNVDPQTLNRIGSAVINAAVNGQSMGRLDGIVAQQRAELAALRNSDMAVYQQRINTAQQILSDADRMDPSWYARTRMADVAGMEANQFRQAMRNIAVRQGGSFDSGQANAYERGAALHTARSKALAYTTAFGDATQAQNSMRAQGAALLGPDDARFRNLQADAEIQAGWNRAHQESAQSTWGGLAAGLFEGDYKPSTSPDPTAPSNQGNQGLGDTFLEATRHPFNTGGGD